MVTAKLQGRGLLTPIQKQFLRLFSELSDQRYFYLTGGTALAEFYLGHRLSFDLDFFTAEEGLILPASYALEKHMEETGLAPTIVRRFSTFVEFLVTKGEESLKVDLALDSPFRFAPPVPAEEGVLINNYQDLRVDKLLAYFGRAEPRDAVDLYFILQEEPLGPILEQASIKDPGFDLYYFALALEKSNGFPDKADRWPVKMLVEFNARLLKQLFHQYALMIMNQVAGRDV
ncbi:MAG TPA: nucleotidyl transferase AbiEii/AbiGii toxin family protein [Anaerolineales bacterium]|nr:nucleotidyl transferase AbiEii/AbiGii toxin family protein [Anaerolineales bacterium]